jgi:hypothetical protein
LKIRFAIAVLLSAALSRADGPPAALSSVVDAERTFAKK